MKKILLFSTLVVALLITGCGKDNKEAEGLNELVTTPTPTVAPANNKRLLCEQKVQTVDVDMIADFEEDELTYLGLKYEMDLSQYTDAQINAIKAQDMCATVKASMATYTDSFTNCKQSIENKMLLITADFDLDKLVGTDLSRKTSIELAKAELEKQNYSCTISNK